MVELEQVILILAVIFVLAKLAALLFQRFGIPGLVGEIIVGILLANLFINGQSPAEMLGIFKVEGGKRVGTELFDVLYVFSEIGVIFLLFSVGIETRVKDLMSVGKAAFLVALLGVVFPFLLGYIYVDVVYTPGNIYHAMFLGAAMVATSVGITARVIKEMNLTDVIESRIIIGAAVIDDVMGMIVLAIVTGMAKSGDINIVNVASITITAILFVVIIMIFCMKGVPVIHDRYQAYIKKKYADGKKKAPQFNMLAVSIAVCLIFAFLAEYIGLAAIIGAFLAGMIFADYAAEWNLGETINGICTFLVSFFFVYVGLQVDVTGVTTEVLITVCVVIILAIIGKYVGCSIGAKIGEKDLDKASLNIIGVGMIPRGEVGIIVATIGLGIVLADGSDAMTPELYTVVVLMSVITTIIAPPLLSHAFKKKYGAKMDGMQ